MATKAKKTAKKQYRVARYWPVEYRSYAYVQASSPEEAARLALEDDDYSDQESCDGSDGPTEIGAIVEITPEGLEIEHPVPANSADESARERGPELLAALLAILAAANRGPVAADSQEIVEASELAEEIAG